jgi:hypothetical protein
MGRFSELLAAEQQQAPRKGRFSELLAQEQAGSTDPEVPAAPWHMAGHQLQTQSKPPPQGSTHLANPPAADMLKLGLKANPQDRLAGAKELYPDSLVEPINDGSVVVRRPSGEVYNFDAPDIGNTLIRHARDLIPGLEPEDSNPTVQRSLNEADAAAVPELALRGTIAGAGAALAPLALAPQVIMQTVAGNVAEKARAGINSLTAGGESRSSLDVEKDAAREGDAAGIGTAFLGLAAKPFQSALQNLHARLPTWVPGAADAAARETATTMGATAKPSEPLRQAVSDVEALGVPREKAPLSILERANPDAGPRLKEIYSDPKVTNKAMFDERAGQDAVRSASEARIRDVTGAAQGDVHEAERGLLDATTKARNEAIDAGNQYRQDKVELSRDYSGQVEAQRGRNAAAKNDYNSKLDSRDEAYRGERQKFTREEIEAQNAHEQQKFDARKGDAQSRYEELKAHQEASGEVKGRNRGLEAEHDAQVQAAKEKAIAAQNDYAELRLKRSGRQVDARNNYTQAREDQAVAVNEARKARNQSLKDIRKSDPALDEILDTAKPRDIRTILEKHLSPDDLHVEELNANWAKLDELRQPISKPRLEAPVAPPLREPVPQAPALEPLPERPLAKPRTMIEPLKAREPPMKGPKPSRPAYEPKPVKPIPDAPVRAKAPEVDSAKVGLLEQRQKLKLSPNSPEVVHAEDTARAVKESGRRVKPDKPKAPLLPTPVRFGLRAGFGLGSMGLTEVPGLAAKFARFAKGDKIGRKLITSPEVKAKVLQMLQDGIPDRDISKWLATTGSLAGQEAADD